jgi:enamine deaminase RidA (YjgF/YER057c/UK114 family)
MGLQPDSSKFRTSRLGPFSAHYRSPALCYNRLRNAMRIRTLTAMLGIAWLCVPAGGQQNDGPLLDRVEPQVRLPLKELPEAVVAETGRLAYAVSPLSSKGLLSQQIGDALDALLRQAKNAPIAGLRAFVAGSGDTRRVRILVAETFTARRLPLPVLTVVQAGALPGRGVQIVMEATGVSRQAENPQGIAFLHAQASDATGLPPRVTPLVKKALSDLKADLAASGMDGKDVLRAACFLSSLEDYTEARRAVSTEFPRAVLNFVQPLRAPLHGLAQCEIVARIRGTAPEAPAAGGFSRVAMVRSRRVVLSGAQIAFGSREEDARLAYRRLGKVLEENGSSLRQAAWLSIYALSAPVGEQARHTGSEFLNEDKPPAGARLVCEDLPALDASFAIDVVARL